MFKIYFKHRHIMEKKSVASYLNYFKGNNIYLDIYFQVGDFLSLLTL